MKLLKLLKELEYTTLLQDCDIKLITCDSRQVEEGTLFIAISGTRNDGHVYVPEIKDKAAAVLVEYDMGIPNQIIVEKTRAAYALICANYFGHPSRKLHLIGVTGTNGKTTTTYLLKHILETAGKKVGLLGSIHNEIADMVIPAKYTTPDPYQLHSMFARMVEAGCEYVVMEASSHALDQQRLVGCNFDVSIFTNLTQDHLDYHETMEKYFQAKKLLFDMTKKAIVNIDDAYGKVLAGQINSTTFSTISDGADFTAKNIKTSAKGSKFALLGNSLLARVNFIMPGNFSVSNAMAAATACLELGIDFNLVVHGLNTCKGISGRCELIDTNANFSVIRDYAHSPDSLEKIITTVKSFAPARVVVLFGCAGNRDRSKRRIMSEIVSRYADFAVLTSDNPRDEDPNRIIEDAMPGLLEHKTPYKIITDRYDAIRWAVENCQKDDILILAGKGHEDYQVLDYGTIYFDEKIIVEELLRDV